MNSYKFTYHYPESSDETAFITERTEATARKALLKRFGKDIEITGSELHDTDVNATKEQERETMEKIKAMVAELGPQSYLKTAFEGVFEVAEMNIDEDAAYSFPGRVSLLEEQLKEMGSKYNAARSDVEVLRSQLDHAQEQADALIECDDTMSSRDLVEAIEKSLGIPSGYGTIWRRVNGIRDFFNTNKGYLLIIDEADKLVSKYTQKKMEILRAIYDQSDVGVVIAGEPKLEAAIKTYLARMANRVDFYISLKGLEPSEVEKYVSEFEVAPDAMVELKARACNMQTGCFRLLDRTLSNVKRILEERGENIVTLKTIEQASSLMML